MKKEREKMNKINTVSLHSAKQHREQGLKCKHLSGQWSVGVWSVKPDEVKSVSKFKCQWQDQLVLFFVGVVVVVVVRAWSTRLVLFLAHLAGVFGFSVNCLRAAL